MGRSEADGSRVTEEWQDVVGDKRGKRPGSGGATPATSRRPAAGPDAAGRPESEREHARGADASPDAPSAEDAESAERAAEAEEAAVEEAIAEEVAAESDAQPAAAEPADEPDAEPEDEPGAAEPDGAVGLPAGVPRRALAEDFDEEWPEGPVDDADSLYDYDDYEDGHSTFTPPFGVPMPPLPQDEHPTSEFAVPKGLLAREPEPVDEHPTSEFAVPEGFRLPEREQPGSAFQFTPAGGVPTTAGRGPMARRAAPWQDRMRTMVRMPLAERPAPEPSPRGEDETGPAAPRVLDLTLRIGELLLAGGEGAEDVETSMFAVAHAYGLDRCEPTVTFTLLSVTYQPSLVDDPVSLSRTVRRRGTDYTRLAAVFRLVDDITSSEVTLEEAYRTLAEIRRNRHPFSKNELTMATGLLAGAAATLVGGGPLVFVLAALGAMAGDRLAWLCSSRGLPEFYQFVAAAMPPAAIGVMVTMGLHEVFDGVRASAVITGGLFALIPGRALVAAVHDGLTGYYITAAARLLEVMYLIVGIVCGVLLVLYLGEQFGPGFDPDTVYSIERPVTQLFAAMLLAFAFCVLLQQELRTVLWATLNGGVAWLIFATLAHTVEIDPVPATVAAAGLVGLFGQLLSRYQFASAMPYITAAIGPLLPGSATYFGLLGIAQGNTDKGFQYLATAAALALAIAIGVNLGGELARLFIKTPGLETPLPGRRAAKRTRGF
ncbi:threonine/serine exporter family protein [Streptomyces sp. XM4193]|nr:threonine/serine exporter family protein [Streptomyces sp. XM4193]MCK1798315.1 threonine/serine exporter family protein [Streptomyces sp. XM4193]